MKKLLSLALSLSLISCGSPQDSSSESVSAVTLPLTSGQAVVPCPPGSPVGAVCVQAKVACDGNLYPVDTRLVIDWAYPFGAAPKGTVVIFQGTGSTGYASPWTPVMDGLKALGFKAVAVSYSAEWPSITPPSIRVAACRNRAVLDWVKSALHGSGGPYAATRGFCGVGSSGGGSALAHVMAHYQGENLLNAVTIVNGAPLVRLDYGCEPFTFQDPSLPGPSKKANSCGPQPHTLDFGPFGGWIDSLEGTTSCASTVSDTSNPDIAKWQSDSVLDGTEDVDYPATKVTAVHCYGPSTAAGMSELYLEAVTSAASLTCVPSCNGEGVLDDPAGVSAILSEVSASCHQ